MTFAGCAILGKIKHKFFGIVRLSAHSGPYSHSYLPRFVERHRGVEMIMDLVRPEDEWFPGVKSVVGPGLSNAEDRIVLIGAPTQRKEFFGCPRQTVC